MRKLFCIKIVQTCIISLSQTLEHRYMSHSGEETYKSAILTGYQKISDKATSSIITNRIILPPWKAAKMIQSVLAPSDLANLETKSFQLN